jgi:DNA-binding transcriptional MerR regulator
MFHWGSKMDRNDGGTPKYEAERWLTTGEMARLSQTTLRTVRFYEAEGLITSREREDGSHRKFPASELKKLQIISDLREAGLSLPDIKALAALKGGCTTAEQAAGRMTATLCAQLEEIDRRVATLRRVRAELTSMVGMLRVCRDCTHPDFPVRCDGCEMVERPGVERATQLLWKH